MISQAYRPSYKQSSPSFQFSVGDSLNRMKKPQKLTRINQSITSTRDQSSHHSTTPTKLIENLRKKSIILQNPDSSGLDQMKKQLETIFQALPKIQKKLVRTHKDKRKNPNISFEEQKSESINKIYRLHSPNRSKSTLATKKQALPRLHQENSELSDLQKYLFDFHQKSKFLLGQLEQKVLGKETIN